MRVLALLLLVATLAWADPTHFSGPVDSKAGFTVGGAPCIDATGHTAGNCAGGGSTLDCTNTTGVFHLCSIDIDSAHLLAMNIGNSATWVPLLPSPGGRKYQVIFDMIAHYRAGTTPYNAIATVHLYPPDSNIEWMRLHIDTTASGDVYTQAPNVGDTPFGSAGAVLFNAPGFELENQPVLVFVADSGGTALTTGNGTLTVRVWYVVVDGGPATTSSSTTTSTSSTTTTT